MNPAAGPPTPVGGEPSQYMSFLIDGHTYAIPLSQVAEITPFRELNRMPHMPESVEGLLDMRGQVLPVISLRTRMDLPKKESHEGDAILIIDHQGSKLGFLVDQVESVITTSEGQKAEVSPLLEGSDGVWVREILLLGARIVLVLEPASLSRLSLGESEKTRQEKTAVQVDDVELMLDEDLKNLLTLAGGKEKEKIYPQLESVVSRTEQEVAKVLERAESMLAYTDRAFAGLSAFRQEVAMQGLPGYDERLAMLDEATNKVQNGVFDLIGQLQFQDIVRQKLEKVLTHISGMHNVISTGLG